MDRDAFFRGFSEVINDNLIAEHLAEKCLQSQKNEKETAYFVSKCLHENSPVNLKFDLIQHFVISALILGPCGIISQGNSSP